MRTMYDAVTARNIPADAGMVAGYIDKIKLEPWSAADWARFPRAVKVTIVKKASTNDGDVLDVEPGDANPAQAPGWVKMRRAAGADPTVYMNYSTWPTVQAEFVRQGVAHPHYWVAKYDGVATFPTLNGITAVAKQYRGDVPPGIDINCVADYWPGVDANPAPNTGGGSLSGPTTGVDLMERRTLPKSPSTRSERLWLPGSPGTAVIIRPRIAGDGFAPAPVFLGDIFAWGNDHNGIGEKYNPNKIPGYDKRLESHRRIELPNALWADLNYSCNDDFEVDIVG